MNAPPRNFDRMARIYPALEWIAFGRDLERARFAWLDRLRGRRNLLLIGEGDGRALARLASLVPEARLHYVDARAGWAARAARRLAADPHPARAIFQCADALTCDLVPATYDAVTTLFFLDCFTTPQVEELVTRISASLQPGALWLFADFVLPERGLPRLRARAWLKLLYLFFRWRTGIAATALPPSEAVLVQAGWRPTASRDFQQGLLRSAVYERAP